jgi:hypothetical protein
MGWVWGVACSSVPRTCCLTGRIRIDFQKAREIIGASGVFHSGAKRGILGQVNRPDISRLERAGDKDFQRREVARRYEAVKLVSKDNVWHGATIDETNLRK